MRRILIFLTAFFVMLSFSACKENRKEETREAVVINLPKDDSVNGYRTGSNFTDNTVVSADSVGIDNSTSQNNINKFENANTSGAYCANKNSKVFHKSDCSSVLSMKEANKTYFNDRTVAVQNGYKSCSRCKP